MAMMCATMKPKIDMEDTIMAFIRPFQNEGTVKTFTEGQCYWFAYILVNRFLLAEIAYNPVRNHFAARIASELYDITGRIENDGHWLDWDEYMQAEPLDAERVYENCIVKVNGK